MGYKMARLIDNAQILNYSEILTPTRSPLPSPWNRIC